MLLVTEVDEGAPHESLRHISKKVTRIKTSGMMDEEEKKSREWLESHQLRLLSDNEEELRVWQNAIHAAQVSDVHLGRESVVELHIVGRQNLVRNGGWISTTENAQNLFELDRESTWCYRSVECFLTSARTTLHWKFEAGLETPSS